MSENLNSRFEDFQCILHLLFLNNFLQNEQCMPNNERSRKLPKPSLYWALFVKRSITIYLIGRVREWAIQVYNYISLNERRGSVVQRGPHKPWKQFHFLMTEC